ncbi:MAG TPA: hypothetical protein VJW20_20215 [Candidatus Angelobacter sp.]|nr:hypothetical protein [Candidatus Angelobacter sp.]
MILVQQDVEGLRLAAREMFDYTLMERDINRQVENLLKADPDTNPELIAKLIPQSKVSPGYGYAVAYLLWMEDKLATGIEFSGITADEAEGLAMLRRVRAEWQQEHPACGHCGERVRSRTQKHCRNCMREFS